MLVTNKRPDTHSNNDELQRSKIEGVKNAFRVAADAVDKLAPWMVGAVLLGSVVGNAITGNAVSPTKPSRPPATTTTTLPKAKYVPGPLSISILENADVIRLGTQANDRVMLSVVVSGTTHGVIKWYDDGFPAAVGPEFTYNGSDLKKDKGLAVLSVSLTVGKETVFASKGKEVVALGDKASLRNF